MKEMKTKLNSKFNNITEKMKQHKVLSLFAVMAILMIVGISAAYIFSYSTIVTYEISGTGENILVLTDLENQVILANESLQYGYPIVLNNPNGEFNTSVNISIYSWGYDQNCDLTNDVVVRLFNENSEILHNSNITIVPGENAYSLNLTLLNERICPQKMNVSLIFSE